MHIIIAEEEAMKLGNREDPPSEGKRKLLVKVEHLKKNLSDLVKENPQKSEEVDKFLVNGNFEGIRECVPYGEFVANAMIRVAESGVKSWDDCRKYLFFLIERDKGEWKWKWDDGSNVIFMLLFQGLAEFKNSEIILLLAQELDKDPDMMTWMLRKLCKDIPTDSSESAVNWYNNHRRELIYQGAIVASRRLNSTPATIERPFYIISKGK